MSRHTGNTGSQAQCGLFAEGYLQGQFRNYMLELFRWLHLINIWQVEQINEIVNKIEIQSGYFIRK